MVTQKLLAEIQARWLMPRFCEQSECLYKPNVPKWITVDCAKHNVAQLDIASLLDSLAAETKRADEAEANASCGCATCLIHNGMKCPKLKTGSVE